MKMIKMKTAAEFRKEVSASLSKETTEILTGSYNYRTRDGPEEEIEQFRNELQRRMSSSIYARLEYLLKKGYRIESLEAMISAGENEKDVTVKWAEKKGQILWPKWKKIKREAKNEKRRGKKKIPAAA
jgi:hypothetical protein